MDVPKDSMRRMIRGIRGGPALLLAFVIVLGPAGVVRAQPWRFTAGAGAWVPQWIIGVGQDRIKSDYAVAPEISLDLRRDRLFGGLRFGMARFSFHDDEVCSSNKSNCTRILGLRSDFRQWEAVTGYAPWPWIGAYVGLLVQNQELRYRTETSRVTTRQDLASGTAGLIFNTPVGQRGDFFFGKAAFVGLEMQDSIGGIFELGTALTFKRLPVIFLMTLRYQNFYYKSNDLVVDPIDHTRTRDSLLGLSAGIRYGF